MPHLNKVEDLSKLKSEGVTRRKFIQLLSAMTFFGFSDTSKNRRSKNLTGGGEGMEERAKISLVKTADRKEGIKKAISLLELEEEFKGREILLKPNFNTADPFPASTHNDCLEQIVYELRNMGSKKITLGERSGPPLTEEVMEEKGIFALVDELGIDLVDFDKLSKEDLPLCRPDESHWDDGFRVAGPVLNAENIVSTCCVKTHGYGGVFTMSLKLSVGIVPRRGYDYMGELHSSPDMRKMIAEINQVYSPSLVVMDAMEVFTDGGPAHGERKEAGIIFAGKDRVALDASGVALLKNLGAKEEIMNKDIFEQEQIKRAAQLGLGVDGPEKIDFITPDEKSQRKAEELKSILLDG